MEVSQTVKVTRRKYRLPVGFRTPALVALLAIPSHSLASDHPTLKANLLPGHFVRVEWPGATSGFQLESSRVLGAGASWQPVSAPPVLTNGNFGINLQAAETVQFFRLREGPGSLTDISDTSPANGESEVAVTRETILRFSAPLAANSVITSGGLYASFAGRHLLSRSELSSDRKTATLFYLENLPASSRVSLVFDPSGLTDEAGRAVDGDGDGQPGGVFTMQFDTIGIAPLSGTGVSGQVYAAELENGTNKPLQGVTITVDGAEETLRATTGPDGTFRLQPCPPGQFFVHIDGRTAAGSHWPGGAYFRSSAKCGRRGPAARITWRAERV